MGHPHQTEVDSNNEDALAMLGAQMDGPIAHVEVSAAAALNKSEVEAQLDAAHRHRRSVTAFLREAGTLATLNQEIAEACIYSVPRGGKQITGPSVRLAEICASAYGNLHIGARVVDIEEKQIVAQGVAWDLEKNLRVTMEVRRPIVNKSGKRFNDDMINTTGNAAASIALRNAIFRVVPRAYVDNLFAKVRSVAVGDAKTLSQRRQEVVDRLMKITVPQDRIFARLGKPSIDDVTLEDVELLIGLGTSIKGGETTIDEAFPPVVVVAAAGEEGKRISLGKPKTEAKPPEPAQAPPVGTQTELPKARPTKVNNDLKGLLSFLGTATKAGDLEIAKTNYDKYSPGWTDDERERATDAIRSATERIDATA